MIETRIHKETGLLVRSDGAVYMRIKSSKSKYHWTYGCKDNGGYMIVCYKRKFYLVHRLIAETFLPNTENKPFIDHINQIRNDNRVSNLRWCTQKENLTFDDQDVQKKKVANTDYKAIAKKIDYAAKVENTDYKAIAAKRSKKVLQFTLDGQFVKEWVSTAEAGRNGFDQRNVSACCRGNLKKHKGFRWQYA